MANYDGESERSDIILRLDETHPGEGRSCPINCSYDGECRCNCEQCMFRHQADGTEKVRKAEMWTHLDTYEQYHIHTYNI